MCWNACAMTPMVTRSRHCCEASSNFFVTFCHGFHMHAVTCVFAPSLLVQRGPPPDPTARPESPATPGPGLRASHSSESISYRPPLHAIVPVLQRSCRKVPFLRRTERSDLHQAFFSMLSDFFMSGLSQFFFGAGCLFTMTPHVCGADLRC